MPHDYYTLEGYRRKNNRLVTESMEDYLEMICRYSLQEGYIRVNTLAELLNVKPSSSSKMVGVLKQAGLVSFERYGIVRPTDKGMRLGKYLLYRHDVLQRFFCWLNHSEDELEQVEQVEHYMTPQSVHNIELFLKDNCKEKNSPP